MRRFSFLTVFLTCLTIAFAIAVVVRIRAYRSSVVDGQPPLSETTTAGGAAATDTGAGASSTGTIVSVSPAAEQRARMREQLLRETQPAAAPSAVTQTVAQPRRAQQPAPTAAAPVSREPLPPPKVVAVAQPQPSHANPVSAVAPAPKDPNSDTTPPQLLSIEFDPSEIHDGHEARVVMTATDDLSGIRGISGTVTSPTGKALQGFAGVRDGETNRYIGHVMVPKNAEEGAWRVNVVTMSDNASNSVTLSLAQGTLRTAAVLRVISSESDQTPPALKSIRVEKPSMRVGEPNPIYVEASDDKSGVNLVSAVFQSPNKRARIGAGCRHGDGDEWICELSLPSCIDCGEWQLEQVTLQDRATNLATYRTDNPIVANTKINIGGDACDNEPPRLLSAVVDDPVVTLGRDAVAVTITITATDDACGVEGASGQYAGPGTGAGGFFPFRKASGDTWVGSVPIDPRAPRGTWRITSIQLTDKGHNLRIIYANDPLLANATFVVR